MLLVIILVGKSLMLVYGRNTSEWTGYVLDFSKFLYYASSEKVLNSQHFESADHSRVLLPTKIVLINPHIAASAIEFNVHTRAMYSTGVSDQIKWSN